MYHRALQQMRASVRAGRLVFPEHVQEELDDDDLYAVDIEHCILTGEIRERQWDNVWGEWKYVIEGADVDGDPIEVVAKPGSNNATVLITTYRV